MIQSSLLLRAPELIHGFSDKTDGNMSYTKAKLRTQKSKVTENRQNFLDLLGVTTNDLVLSKQTHGNVVQVVTQEERGLARANQSPFSSADGLVTSESGVYLSVFAADCLPILFYEPKAKIVALVHAGWRGLANGVVTEAVKQIKAQSGEATALVVWIGPHIKVCHYYLEKSQESYQPKLDAFTSRKGIIISKKNRLFLDLTKVAVQQLVEQGVRREQIDVSPDCTACEVDRFYSYHLNHGQTEGVMMGVIGQNF